MAEFGDYERAIEGRFRRAYELIEQDRQTQDLIWGCFYGPGVTYEKDIKCRCLDSYPGWNPECPQHGKRVP